MKPLPVLLIAVATLLPLARAARAETVVEGTVALAPETAAKGGGHDHYQASEAPGKPEAPVAVVYLEGAFPGQTNAAPLLMGQRRFQFEPGVLPIQTGSTVAFPNFDDAYHNVFSYSKAKRFDLGRYRKDEQPATQTFNQPGVVKLYCEIHEHMRATILVLDTPHFVRTDAEGHYRLVLPGVPDGHYTLKAWVNEKTTRERPLDVKTDQTLRIDFPAP